MSRKHNVKCQQTAVVVFLRPAVATYLNVIQGTLFFFFHMAYY